MSCLKFYKELDMHIPHRTMDELTSDEQASIRESLKLIQEIANEYDILVEFTSDKSAICYSKKEDLTHTILWQRPILELLH